MREKHAFDRPEAWFHTSDIDKFGDASCLRSPFISMQCQTFQPDLKYLRVFIKSLDITRLRHYRHYSIRHGRKNRQTDKYLCSSDHAAATAAYFAFPASLEKSKIIYAFINHIKTFAIFQIDDTTSTRRPATALDVCWPAYIVTAQLSRMQ